MPILKCICRDCQHSRQSSPPRGRPAICHGQKLDKQHSVFAVSAKSSSSSRMTQPIGACGAWATRGPEAVASIRTINAIHIQAFTGHRHSGHAGAGRSARQSIGRGHANCGRSDKEAAGGYQTVRDFTADFTQTYQASCEAATERPLAQEAVVDDLYRPERKFCRGRIDSTLLSRRSGGLGDPLRRRRVLDCPAVYRGPRDLTRDFTASLASPVSDRVAE